MEEKQNKRDQEQYEQLAELGRLTAELYFKGVPIQIQTPTSPGMDLRRAEFKIEIHHQGIHRAIQQCRDLLSGAEESP
ncbi:MAG: hypothetical protein HOC74_30270 [Gemmatimonadetes bacterium]|jgi:hypothetical protein|nr:hypothetical protein [Gemmatimonadota bacterium]MBT7915795.1 hypothetical protein [Candidatus Bathyarchaeota archaeon]